MRKIEKLQRKIDDFPQSFLKVNSIQNNFSNPVLSMRLLKKNLVKSKIPLF